MTEAPLTFQILGYAGRIARPQLLWLLLAVAAVGLAVAWAAWQRHRALRRAVKVERLDDKVVPGLSTVRPVTQGGLSVLGLALLAFAVAGPQCGERAELSQRTGADIVVAIDASNSMLGRDILPSRLGRSKLELASLIDRLKGDRVGLVVFAGQAFVQCPLTTDYGAAKLFLRAIDPSAMPVQGTAIAEALTVADQMLKNADRGATGKAVLLLTDGEDHEGDVEAALEPLVAAGVRIYALGVGTATGAQIPILSKGGDVVGYRKDRDGRPVLTKLEDGQLRKIAEATGGKYFAASGGDIGMGEVFAELDRLEKTEFESRLTVQFGEAFHFFALPGFLLLLAAAAIRPGRREG